MVELSPEARDAIKAYLWRRLAIFFSVLGLVNVVALVGAFVTLFRLAESEAREAVSQRVREDTEVRSAHLVALTNALATVEEVGALKQKAADAEADVDAAKLRIVKLEELLSETGQNTRLQVLEKVDALSKGGTTLLDNAATIQDTLRKHEALLISLEAWKKSTANELITNAIRANTKDGVMIRFSNGSYMQLSSGGTKNNIESFDKKDVRHNAYLYGRVQEVD